MKSTIYKDSYGRINIEAETGFFTTIPADFDASDIACEAGTLYSQSGSKDSWLEWESAIKSL